MADINEVFGSGEYLKSDDLEGGDILLTIASVGIKDFEEKGSVKRKPILTFNGTDKKLVCNITNARIIAEVHGNDTDGWIGKQVTLYPARVDFQGKLVDAIRVRIPAKKGAGKPAWHRGPDEPPAEINDDVPF